MTDLITNGRELRLPDGTVLPCSMGRSGLIAAADKREGDGATPIGRWRLLHVYCRADRIAPPDTALPLTAITDRDGWCDAPDDPNYNRAVTLPYPASHETLMREDGLYDLLVTTDHNTDPAVPGLGSAIFLHCRHPQGKPTAGCIAVDRAALIALVEAIDVDSRLIIEA
ncbi:L,D-transpeptidase family protein [Rhodospirillaceae bacterium KN72]|uniref:L,D-transpeptidase family protein n=1 Tax=Pacificispira spongiicola TaxID=2729598 RepID=A0A7Y0HES1_9PROT|nr:L,D-transpeptidase family protein [Pacificispira spongiicola]NMM45020.1 L,D-transpeptidase family protein [Pacificispira spongiicola]